jgi:serine/threonine protein kinase
MIQMNEPQLERIEAIFQGAADRPPSERAAFLESECAGDAILRGRVEAMLVELEQGDSLALPADAFAADDEADLVEGPGTVIGRYKLLQKIGEGGFGVVYMAEQERPIVRRVALKIIKLGMDTREVVARFEAERQALALMDHPNIARVLDGGATESGRPFFVMELVRGVSITRYCDENQLPTEERLRLFTSVCHAVQHAHQKGVIHRDIKPSNVMVTLHDGQPVVKVIDFGVAKAMHSRLTEKTLFTAFGRFIGTPAYMSPEQAELSGLDVDTRTDIYSLGVLLYELLTGTTPFDLQGLFDEGLAAVQRTIREEPPERPSLRISTSGDAGVANRRGTDVPALSRLLRGDLDWIVMKCLEKERVRRYETASELASDIDRHLAHDPVLAGPPSSSYRLRKFLARNRAAAVSIAVLTLGLLVGLVGLAVGLVEASTQRDEALAAERRAQVEVERTRKVTQFLVDTLALTDPDVAMTADLSVATLLNVAASRLGDVFQDQPEAEARLSVTIGRGYRALGENRLAELHLRRGIEGLQALPEPDRAELYFAMWDLTHVLFTLEEPDAMAVAQAARRVAHDEIRVEHPGLAAVLDEFIEIVNDAAFSMDLEAEARVPASFEETRLLADAALSPGDPLWPLVADAWVSAGYSVWYGPLDPFTTELWGHSVAVLRRELPANHPYLGEVTGLYVDSLNRNGRADEAEVAIRAMVEDMRKVLPRTSPQLASAECLLGQNLASRGEFEEAEDLLVSGYATFARSIGEDVNNFLLADACSRVLALYDAWGRPEAAASYRDELRGIAAYSDFIQPWRIISLALGPELADVVERIEPLQAKLGNLSYVPRKDAFPEAEVAGALEEVLALTDERFAEHPELQIVFARYLLLWATAMQGDGPVRRRMIEQGLGVLSADPERYGPEVAGGHALLSDVLLAGGEPELAARHARAGHALLRERGGDWTVATVKARVAHSCTGLGLHAEAEELLLAAHDVFRSTFGDANLDAVSARAQLVENYTAWGKPERARAFAAPPAQDR